MKMTTVKVNCFSTLAVKHCISLRFYTTLEMASDPSRSVTIILNSPVTWDCTCCSSLASSIVWAVRPHG